MLSTGTNPGRHFFDHFAKYFAFLDNGFKRKIFHIKYSFDLRIFLDFLKKHQKYLILLSLFTCFSIFVRSSNKMVFCIIRTGFFIMQVNCPVNSSKMYGESKKTFWCVLGKSKNILRSKRYFIYNISLLKPF